MKTVSGLILLLLATSWIGAQTVAVPQVAPPISIPVPAPPPAAALSPSAEAEAALRKGDFDHAVRVYRGILDVDRTSVPAAVGLIRALLKWDKVTEADEAAATALASQPNVAALHAAMGDVYYREGRLNRAEKEYRAALGLDPRCARGAWGMGRIYTIVSMHASARKAYDVAHRLAPEDPDIFRDWLRTLSGTARAQALVKYLAITDVTDPDELAHLHSGVSVNAELHGQHVWERVTPIAATDIHLPKMHRDPRYVEGWGLPVSFNSSKNYLLLLDTGASGILISRKVAERVGARKLAETDFHGIGDKGPVSGYVALVDSVRIGPIEFHNCVVDVSDRKDVADRDGIIGADVFDDYLVTIDFSSSTLHVEPLPRNPQWDGTEGPHDRYIAPEMQSFAKVYHVGSKLFVPTYILRKEASVTEEPLLFLLDTGSNLNLLSTALARKVGKPDREQNVILKGLSGQVEQLYTLGEAELAFSRFRQKNLDILAFDLDSISKSMGIETSGILGLEVLGMMRLTIDYRDGLVDFNSQPRFILKK